MQTIKELQLTDQVTAYCYVSLCSAYIIMYIYIYIYIYIYTNHNDNNDNNTIDITITLTIIITNIIIIIISSSSSSMVLIVADPSEQLRQAIQGPARDRPGPSRLLFVCC